MGLLGYRDVEELAASGMWHGREGSARLMVPIGIDTVGQPVTVDLKESAHGGMGPHGLCIGATGSGNSELRNGVQWPYGNNHYATCGNLCAYITR